MDQIRVSIFCLTYNHADYIRDAFGGFLAQKTDFRYEIFVYDDASTDGTSDIVREYKERYPENFIVHICEENTFRDLDVRRKYSEIISQLNGEYIALCEGDDYWIDPYKLQIQVDYMDTHPECSLYMHNALWYDYDEKSVYSGNPFVKGSVPVALTYDEIIQQKKSHPPTASFLYRRKHEIMPDFFYEAAMFDYPIQLHRMTIGKVIYDSRIMSVYRWHTPGSFNYISQRNESHNVWFQCSLIWFLLEYDKYTEYSMHELIRNKIQGVASGFFEALKVGVPLFEYMEEAKQKGYNIHPFQNGIMRELEEFKKRISDQNYVCRELKDFCNEHENIWIMGTGKYASIVIKQLENNHISVNGYMTSNQNTVGCFNNQKVININKCKELGDVGLVVGINPTDNKNILESINPAGIKNYYNPFYFEWIFE